MTKPSRILFLGVLFFSTVSIASPPLQPDLEGRKKIAVIGAGGAGLVSALLLADHHDVTVFEKSDRLGGDQYSVPVTIGQQTIMHEAGAEFLNPREFPRFLKLLEELNVPTHPFQLTTTFTNHQGRSLVVTPLSQNRTAWGSFLPRNLYDLLHLKGFFDRSQRFIAGLKENASTQEGLSVGQYIAQQKVSQRFKQEFLLPFLSAGWAMNYAEMSTWSAENVMRTLLTEPDGNQAPIWLEIMGGMDAYIQKIRSQLEGENVDHPGEHRARLLLSSPVEGISYDDHEQMYEVRSKTLTDTFDLIVVASPAESVAPLLGDLDHLPEVHELRAKVGEVKYYDATVVLHSDPAYMPRNRNHWSVMNVRTNATETQSGFTAHKHHLCPQYDALHRHVFKTWILDTDEMPAPDKIWAGGVVNFRHKKLDFAYLEAKRAVASFQGSYGIYLTGGWTKGDRGESFMEAVMEAVGQIDPASPWLQKLTTAHK